MLKRCVCGGEDPVPSESSLSDLGLQMHCHLGLKGQVARAVNTGFLWDSLWGWEP